MKPLIIGEAPARSAEPGERALAGQCGQRLASTMRISLEEFLDRFETANLLEAWPGRAGKGDAFPLLAARARAHAMALSSPVIVLAGGRVARAFEHDLRCFEWGSLGGAAAIAIPHPSGVNRQWNEPGMAERAGEALRQAVAIASRIGNGRRVA